MNARMLLCIVALGLAACAPQTAPRGADGVAASPGAAVPTPLPQVQRDLPVDEDDPDACGASRWSHLIGQPEAAARAAGLPQPHRIICHNCPVTMDYAPGRLNVELDAQGRVERVLCG